MCEHNFHVDEKNRNHDAGGARVRCRRRVSVDLVAPGEAGYQLREPPPDQPRLEVRPLEELAEDALEDARGQPPRGSWPFRFCAGRWTVVALQKRPSWVRFLLGVLHARAALRQSTTFVKWGSQFDSGREHRRKSDRTCGCSSLSRARRCQRRGSRGRTGHPLQ